jgi:hypothetical protein
LRSLGQPCEFPISTEAEGVGLRAPYVADADGVWRCWTCIDEDERDFAMPARRAVVGPKLSLVVVDVSGMHARGLAVPGMLRRTFVLTGGGGGAVSRLPHINPFTYTSTPDECSDINIQL